MNEKSELKDQLTEVVIESEKSEPRDPTTTIPTTTIATDGDDETEHGFIKRLFPKGPISPENFAWMPSRLFLWWMNGFFWKGYRSRIQEDDLYEMLDCNKSGVLASQLIEKWEREKERAGLKGETPSLIRATIMTFWRRYYTCVIGIEMGGKEPPLPPSPQ